MFDALVVSLRRQQGDERVKELIVDLRRKGYSIDIIATKVVKALGPKAATRVQKLAGVAAPAAQRQGQGYRLTRSRRLKLWMRDAQDNLEDTFDAVRKAFRRS
jgi:hypothetical protein